MEPRVPPSPGMESLLEEYSERRGNVQAEVAWLSSLDPSTLPTYLLAGDQSSLASSNDSLAAYLSPLAEKKRDAIARFLLSLCYKYGVGVQQDHQRGFDLCLRASQQGLAEAQFQIACTYEAASKLEAAVDLYRKAAEQGHAEARVHLGNMYRFGTGVAQDVREAASHYEKAADQGHAEGQWALAFMYANGEGVGQDLEKAFKLNRLAGEQGHVDAQFNVGVMYFQGMGVEQDSDEATEWLRKAADQGYEKARQALQQIGATAS